MPGHTKHLLLSLVAGHGLLLAPAWAQPAATAADVPPPPLCFAPGTPPERVSEIYAHMATPATSLSAPGRFRIAGRWSSTATNPGPLGQGAPTTLTWSVIPDGTFIPAAYPGAPIFEPSGPSTLVARLNGLYGSPSGWLPLFQQVFDRWHQLTGITYVYQPSDDGAAFPDTPGQLGVRGDVRIGGKTIDGNFGILAYNYYPDFGDMVLDAPDSFYNDTSGNSHGLRDTFAHEHGHGMGLAHVCPTNGTKLMEPFITLSFNGPQHDDTLGGQRSYGDAKENNDSAGTAANLGSVPNGVTTLSDVGGDNNVDVDYYKFTVPAGKQVAVTMMPVGTTYLEGPQNVDGSCTAGTSFNSLVLNDLGVALLGTDGATVLASASSNPAGVPESIPNTFLPGAGTYYVKVIPGASNQVQLYTLSLNVTNAPVSLMSISNRTVTEGDAGSLNADFTVTLASPNAQTITVSYATANGTATAGSDYTTTQGALTFTPGSTTRTISVPVLGDTLDEFDETFFVNLSNPSAAGVITDGQGLGTILDNDPPPTVSVNDVSQAEGNAGLSTMTFNVTLSAASAKTISVAFATADGTANAGSDYVANSGALTFSTGTTAKTVIVSVFGDRVFETSETFFVNLSSPSNATILDGQGQGTITNDDTAGFVIDDLTVAEGRLGPTTATFTVSLSPTSGSQTSVDFQTADGTATVADGDYNPAGGSLTFAPGTASLPVMVQVNPDAVAEGAQTFTVGLSNAQGGPVVAFSPGTATILDPQGGADFDGDNKTDILWRHAVSGKNVVWFMNGITRTAGVFTSPDTLADTNWRMVGTNHFNPDGQVDILWRHGVSGKNVVWYMNGITRTAGVFTNPDSLADTNWKMVGTGDFDTNGKADILWRHGVSGKNVIWFMDGITRTGGVFTVPDSLPDTNWQMVGVGDFSSDGRADILWRHGVSGKNVVWYMNGVFRTAGLFTNPSQLPDTNWQMVAVGDFDSNEKPDILFRHGISGKNVVWYMDGITRTGGVFTNPDQLPDTNWRIVGPR